MATMQRANTIILELGTSSSDDIKDLRYGEGRLFRKVGMIIEQLQESGEVGDNVQPIIVITKKKSSKDW
ncbi:MAG: hypothetical protein F6K14_31675 [Symploca sp. SIO2C1]|nr:hypothetical protein [Symploca sp. SIO2C1]